MRLSWLAVLTIALFAATLVVGVVGLVYYYYYRSLLLSLNQYRSLPSVLNKVVSLDYTLYVSPSGTTYNVKVMNYLDNHTLVAYLYNLTGGLVEYVVATYNETSLTSMRLVYPSSSNISVIYTSSNISQALPSLLISASNQTNPLTGTVSLNPFPGLGPVYALPYFTSYYNISWSSLASGGEPSTEATVLYAFTPVSFDGKSYRGLAITITPQSSFLGTSGLYSVSASLIDYSGIPVAVQLTISTGGAYYVSMSLTGISVS